MPEDDRDFSWIERENMRVNQDFLLKRDAEKKGEIGRVLCFLGFHKLRASGIKPHKARDCIMSHYFSCVRCG